MRLRQLAAAAVALSLPLGLAAAGPGGAGAATAPVKFGGTISCALTGKVTLTPALTLSASTQPVTVKTAFSLSTCHASKGLVQGGVTLTKGSITGTATLPTGTTCTSLGSGTLPAGGKVAWKTSSPGAAIAPSTATGFTSSVSLGPPITTSLTKGTVTGSFPVKGTAAMTLTLAQSESTLISDCTSTGVGAITLAAGSGATL
jgi:hypothetical protein